MRSSVSKNYSEGFTLIELMVVIAIIGILSSVVLASLTSARVKARDARRVADLKQIQIALELYRDSHNAYPNALSNLKDSGDLSVIPTDPSTNQSYSYAYKTPSSIITAYHLGANLEQAAGATTLSIGDLDMITSGKTGWSAGFYGTHTESSPDGAYDCSDASSAGFCYDVSNVGTP